MAVERGVRIRKLDLHEQAICCKFMNIWTPCFCVFYEYLDTRLSQYDGFCAMISLSVN